MLHCRVCRSFAPPKGSPPSSGAEHSKPFSKEGPACLTRILPHFAPPARSFSHRILPIGVERLAPEKAPAFQFYPKDFLTDGRVQTMSLAERGAYITLLCICWLEQSLPDDEVRLARIVGLPLASFRKLWPAVRQCFTLTGDAFIHKRLDMEREKQDAFRRRQSDKGRLSATGRQPDVNRESTAVQPDGNRTATGPQPEVNRNSTLLSPISYLQSPKEREKSVSFSPAAPSDPKRDPFTDTEITQRAGKFLERYQDFYPAHRHGARYALKPARDYAAAVTLCQTWDDDGRLDKLAILFLKTDHKFAEEGSRTVPQFLALASWCDGQLASWEAKQRTG